MSADNFARKFAGLQPEPLFDGVTRAPAPEKTRPVRPVGKAPCPKCGERIGLVVSAMRGHQRVLSFKKHWRTRYSGVSFECPGSNTEYARPEGSAL